MLPASRRAWTVIVCCPEPTSGKMKLNGWALVVERIRSTNSCEQVVMSATHVLVMACPALRLAAESGHQTRFRSHPNLRMNLGAIIVYRIGASILKLSLVASDPCSERLNESATHIAGRNSALNLAQAPVFDTRQTHCYHR